MKHFLVLIVILGMYACESGNGDVASASVDLVGFESAKVKGTSLTHVFKKNAEGIMLEEGYLKNGQKDGQWIIYDPAKGFVTSIQSYVDGKLNGYSFKVSTKGYLEEQIGYQNGNVEGKYLQFRYGRPQLESNYSKGELDGIYKKYYDNGKLMEEIEYSNGVQNGIYKYYSDDGTLQLAYEYKNGEKVGGGIVDQPEE